MRTDLSSIRTNLTVAIILILAIVAVTVTIIFTSPRTSTAPDFTLRDSEGGNFTLSAMRGKVVLIDFMYINCESCKIVANNLILLKPSYGDDLVLLSVDILPDIDSDSAIQLYKTTHVPPITWPVARDVGYVVKNNYGVTQSLPHVVVVDKNGVVTWNWIASGPVTPNGQREDMQRAIDGAMSGTAVPTTVAQGSVGALAILAAIGSFFSPCSFPLLPGYMAYYLGIDAESKKKPTITTATGRGFLVGLGMILVYGIIAIVVFAVGYAASGFIGYLGPTVGVILVSLGILTFTPLQYHAIIKPFQTLRQKIWPTKEGEEHKTTTGVKLFAYGVGYGAAGFACVAPLFIAAVLNAAFYGSILYGILVLLVYSVIVIALMIAITIILTEAGQAAVKKMNRYVNLIKKVSGIALIIAGSYLLYFWWISRSP